ncbi:hypothetical protein BDW62DRAFT_187626 [Aspergillus aurantiobrunneus]
MKSNRGTFKHCFGPTPRNYPKWKSTSIPAPSPGHQPPPTLGIACRPLGFFLYNSEHIICWHTYRTDDLAKVL